MLYEMSKLNESDKYRLLTSCIVPRPIAWVTTIDTQGIVNAAPFSFFTGVSIEPPLVIFAVERRKGEKKDTIVNIENTKEFVINLVTEKTVKQMNETSPDYEPEIDEMQSAKLTPIRSHFVKPPSIKESPIHLECTLDQVIEIGSSPHSLVIGKVEYITVEDELIDDDRISMKDLQAVGRLGGKWYTETTSLFELDRLDWRKKEV
ncbi:hypothetical protein CSV74_00810 [Sporosarcina sp. P19]|uniref:flavin reductase family protein n=1 Tax=Sporosarcina sp. P19 TaxID=2048258 RepID=UPI000C173806|nr:flavin reductase family protein [Sporosarcina sp. P19]PIC78098.1 hypothetical protein CSV74_00810 [Sporosarcina sp. P19]